MNHRGTYALLALFFAGLCGLWLADYAKIPTRRDRARMRSRVLAELIDTKPDDLRKLEILGGPEPMVFERRDGNTWQMTTPWDVAADPSMVETLAYHLKELARKPEADTLEGEPAAFGLAPPERTVKLWGAATEAPLATLEVGKAISLDRRYVRSTDSDGIEVVDARGLDLLRLPPIRWRDHELFRVPTFEVDAVRIAAGRGELKIRRDSDAWRIVAPLRALASEARVDGLIADLGTLRVSDDSRFVADNVKPADLDRYGLKTPLMTIEVDAGRGGRRRPSQSIQVGKPVEGKDGQVYARRGDQDEVVAVDARVLKGLGADPNAYRSPKVADIHPARVLRIAVEADGREFEVARSGRGWAIVRPSPSMADSKAIETFLKSLGEVQTGIYLSPSAVPDSGLEPPSMTLKIWEAPDTRSSKRPGPADPKGELALSMKVGRRDAARKSIYAQVEGDRTVLALPDSAIDVLPRSPMAFRDRQVVAVAGDQIELLTLSGPGRTVRLKAPALKLDPTSNAPIGWWMVEPVSAPADPTAVGRLLKLLSGLRAEGLVAETGKPDDLKSFGLDHPVLTLTWSTFPQFSMTQTLTGPVPVPNPGTPTLESHSLRIGSAPPGRPGLRYVTIEGRPLVFTLGLEALSTIDAEFHDRRVLAFDPSHARRLHLAWPDRSFAMIPEEKGGRRDWSIEGAVDAPDFDLGRVGPLLKEVSDLSTGRFAQYLGDFPAVAGLTPPRVTLRVELDDGSPPREIRVGSPAGNGQCFATTSTQARGPIFLIPEHLFASWIKTPRHHDDLPDNVFAP